MRIVFLCDQYPPVVWDGVGPYTANIARALVAIGHEVHVICAKGYRIRDELDAGVHVHRRPPIRLPLLKLLGPWAQKYAQPRDGITHRISLALSYAFWLRAMDLKPDVIETQDGDTRAIFTAYSHDVPLVIHLHTPTMLDLRLRDGSLSLKGKLADALDRYSAGQADALTAPSALIVDTLRHYDWLPDRDVHVIPLPFDASSFSDIPPATHTERTIVAVGRLEWRKAPEVLLQAVALLGQRGVRAKLVFAGRSAGKIEGQHYDAWLQRRAKILRVDCEFTGLIGAQQLRKLYGDARVVAVPSRFDNFPTVAMEAMASARPVVVSRSCGSANMIERSGGGVVVPTDDAEALAAALEPFLLDREHAVRAGEKARQGLSAVEPRRIAKLREKVYRSAIEQHAARQRGAPPPAASESPTLHITP